MPNRGVFELTGGVRGSTKVKRLLDSYASIPAALFAHDQLQTLLLARARERFYPRGSRPHAQKSPEGEPWAPPSPATIKTRRWRGGNTRTDQALVMYGGLRRAITVLRGGNTSAAAMRSPTGANFSIGIESDDPVYASVQNRGGRTPNGKRIPRRRFLGVGVGDIRAVDILLAGLAARAASGRL